MGTHSSPVEHAEAIAEGTGDTETREAVTGLLTAFRRLRSRYLFLYHEGQPHPDPDPVQAALREAEDGSPAPATPDPAEDGDRMLKVDEAAEILSVEPRWLYDRSDSLPFARKLAPRTLRFSEKGLYRWLETRP